MPKDRITTPQGRCRLASVVGIALLLIGCSGDRPGDGAAGSVPVVTPSSAYEPLDYDNAAQEATFAAYRRCAAQQGVQYEGPLQDSTGNGIFFKLAKGDQASQADQQAVGEECPQGVVGLFGTPVGPVQVASFEQAATEFARCMRAHGVPGFPSPEFAQGNPVDDFWQLPFQWSSKPFTAAVTACIDSLRSYLFST